MKNHLNLMSRQARRQQAIRDARRIWSTVLAALALVLAPVGILQWQRCDRASRRQAAIELECAPIRHMRAENVRVQQQIDALRTGERVPLALAQEQSVLALIGLASRSVRELGGAVHLEQFELEQDPLAGISTTPSQTMFTLAGVGRDLRTVTQLADSLRAQPSFRQVELDAQDSNQLGVPELQTFTIECEL